MKNPSGQMRGRGSCFTLIELVLVTMIIVIVFVILMPIIKQLPKCKEVACTYNMRQIAVGYRMYMLDNSNKFPTPKYWLDDLRAPYQYLGKLEPFSCPAAKSVAAQKESDLVGVDYGGAAGYVPSLSDYYVSGTAADIERNYNLNGGFGNNVYNFDPSNAAFQAYIASRTTKRAIYERRHCNHSTCQSASGMTHQMNVMYLDEMRTVVNTLGMGDYYVLNTKGRIVWNSDMTDPWWPILPITTE